MVRQQDVVRVLLKAGWYIARTEDHHIFKRLDDTGRVIVLLHREIKTGTFRNILKQAGLSNEEFERLRRES
jgi:predicted RNA binding protein YcfA (HicA-like mRNA interferase family)